MVTSAIFDGLSPLEGEVLKALLPEGEMKVRQVYEVVSKNQKVALTSVAVMLDRLYGKGLVKRKMETCRGGTRYIYSLKKGPDEMEEEYIKTQVDKIVDSFGEKAVAYFHKRFSR